MIRLWGVVVLLDDVTFVGYVTLLGYVIVLRYAFNEITFFFVDVMSIS